MLYRIKTRWLLSLIVLLLPLCSTGQNSILKGVVTDSITKEPLPFVSLVFVNTSIGTLTDFEGKYILQATKPISALKVSSIGYKSVIVKVVNGKTLILNIRLVNEAIRLDAVTIKAQRKRYHNQDNPAVDLIKNVIKHKNENRKEEFDFYQYEKYDKIQFALSNISENFKNKKAFKKFQFVFDNMDTSKLEGKPVLPIYLKETLSEKWYRKSPKVEKELIKADKMVSFDGYVDNSGLNEYLKYMYQDIDIYANNITLLTNQFISPIASLSPSLYRFYIADTINENNKKYYKLFFYPRNHSDFLFQGFMWITMDSSYAVKKIDMTVNKDINLNWVKELSIKQEFEKIEDHSFVLVYDEFSADFGVSKNSKMGIFGQRAVSYKTFLLNKVRKPSDYTGDEIILSDSTANRTLSYWEQNRPIALSRSEQGVYKTIDSIQTIPAFRRSMDIVMLLLAGYKNLGPYFELGPVNTFYSFNPVEGFRLRTGGRTTTQFSKKINFESYIAYGFNDEKWKYYIGTTYSLSKRSFNEFPLKLLKANYQKDTKIPGQELQFVQEDNFLLSFKRGINDKLLYNKTYNLEFLNEFKNHFSFGIGYKNWTQQPAGGLHFNTNDYNNVSYDIEKLQTSEISLTLRWAPNEQFYQGKVYRIPIYNKYPIITFRFINGFKGMLGGEYDYQNLALYVFKRFYWSQLGYTNILIEGGKVFGTVPFPILDIPRANQSYSYQLLSFNLMNYLEFVSDQYVSAYFDHYFNGFFFNKIPLLKRLKWREAISLKILYGSISDANDPFKNPDLYLFPVNSEGIPITYSLIEKPYIEGSVAVANIFKFFRVDLVKRFNYLDHPDVSQFGLRVRFRFDF
jgi:hypothetical protein